MRCGRSDEHLCRRYRGVNHWLMCRQDHNQPSGVEVGWRQTMALWTQKTHAEHSGVVTRALDAVATAAPGIAATAKDKALEAIEAGAGR